MATDQDKIWKHTGTQFEAALGPMSSTQPIYAFSIYGCDGNLYYYSIFEVNFNDGSAVTVCLISDASVRDNNNTKSGLKHYQKSCWSIKETTDLFVSDTLNCLRNGLSSRMLSHKYIYKVAGIVFMGIDSSVQPAAVLSLSSMIQDEYTGLKLTENLYDFLTGPLHFSNHTLRFNVLVAN